MIASIGFLSLFFGFIVFIIMLFNTMYFLLNLLTKFNFRKELHRLSSIIVCFFYFVGFYECGRVLVHNYVLIQPLYYYFY